MNQLIITRGKDTIAWATTWVVDSIDHHDLVAVPRLRLAHRIAMDLTGMSYNAAFKGSHMMFRGAPRTFVVIHAEFGLYSTAEPDILGFACILPVEGSAKPALSDVIKKTAVMLR